MTNNPRGHLRAPRKAQYVHPKSAKLAANGDRSTQRHPKLTSKSLSEQIGEPLVAKEAQMETTGTPRDPKGTPKGFQRHPQEHFERVLRHLKPLIPLERGT